MATTPTIKMKVTTGENPMHEILISATEASTEMNNFLYLFGRRTNSRFITDRLDKIKQLARKELGSSHQKVALIASITKSPKEHQTAKHRVLNGYWSDIEDLIADLMPRLMDIVQNGATDEKLTETLLQGETLTARIQSFLAVKDLAGKKE